MKYNIGDHVFAKVRGFAAWPAKVTSADAPGGIEKFSVVFYGTRREFANVAAKDLWIYSDVHKAKFATPAHTKKVKFAKGMDEIENEISQHSFQLEPDVVENSQYRSTEVEIANSVEVSKGKNGKTKLLNKDKQRGKVLKHRDSNRELQDDEARNIKLFREKIIEENDGFTCRFCEFASGMLIVAKTHAAHCGKMDQKRRKRAKVYKCTECTDTFPNKASLNKHFRNSHATSSYPCTVCGTRSSSRRNFIKHLRIHDKSYTPNFKCDFCTHRARDRWNLDKHMLSHFRNTNCRSLNSPLKNFSAMTVEVSLTEVLTEDVCNSIYKMVISKRKPQETDSENVSEDWGAVEVDFVACFGQLGLRDSDWEDWQEISRVLGLGPYTGMMSFVEYKNVDDKEVFQVATQEQLLHKAAPAIFPQDICNDNADVDSAEVSSLSPTDQVEDTDPITQLISAQKVSAPPLLPRADLSVDAAPSSPSPLLVRRQVLCITPGKAPSDQTRPTDSGAGSNSPIADEPEGDAQREPFHCDVCDKRYKSKAHLSEHVARMHSDPTHCKLCNVVYPDKYSVNSHQKMCTRRCTYSHCRFQTRHKHAYLKHLRGHERSLRRFSNI